MASFALTVPACGRRRSGVLPAVDRPELLGTVFPPPANPDIALPAMLDSRVPTARAMVAGHNNFYELFPGRGGPNKPRSPRRFSSLRIRLSQT